MTVTAIGITLTVFSFLFNILFFWEWKRTEKKYQDELKIESDEMSILELNFSNIQYVIENDEISPSDKIDNIKNSVYFCSGYLSGMQHNLPKKNENN